MLADTSVWVDHFRRGNAVLGNALDGGEVVIHEFVIGELACGNLRRRTEVLSLLSSLQVLPTTAHDDVLEFVSRRKLAARGLGWIDMHLLAAASIAHVPLVTLDKGLADAAREVTSG